MTLKSSFLNFLFILAMIFLMAAFLYFAPSLMQKTKDYFGFNHNFENLSAKEKWNKFGFDLMWIGVISIIFIIVVAFIVMVHRKYWS